MKINPEDYGFKANHTSDETIYTRPLGAGLLIVEIFKNYWVEYYSADGRMKSFTEKNCRPLRLLEPFLSKCHQVL